MMHRLTAFTGTSATSIPTEPDVAKGNVFADQLPAAEQRRQAVPASLLDTAYVEPASGSPADAARPYVLGYIDGDQLHTEEAIAVARARLGEYSISQRLQLGSIYVDPPGGDGTMFRALLASIERFSPAFVLVPSLAHVAVPLEPVGQTRHQRITSGTAATLRAIDSP